MRFALVLFVLLVVVPTTAQEHAPTVAQCHADANTAVSPLAWNEVNARTVEMAECITIDPGELKYFTTVLGLAELMVSAPGTGDPVNGLQLVLSSDQTQSQYFVPKFKLELRNVGDAIFRLNVGTYLDGVTLVLTDPQGNSTPLRVRGPAGIAGGIVQVVVPVPAASVFSISVDLSEYGGIGLASQLPPGSYSLEARFVGFPVTDGPPAIPFMPYWKGMATSNRVKFEILGRR